MLSRHATSTFLLTSNISCFSVPLLTSLNSAVETVAISPVFLSPLAFYELVSATTAINNRTNEAAAMEKFFFASPFFLIAEIIVKTVNTRNAVSDNKPTNIYLMYYLFF